MTQTKHDVIHAALVWFLASQRRGTHSTKTRAEVSGGGKKPWKQKGTGRARAGSNRSPLWRKGGVIFGPKPRDYGYSFPKKMRKLAIKLAVQDKQKEEKVKIVEAFGVASGKTKDAVKFLKDLGVTGKILIVTRKKGEIFARAGRNIEGVHFAQVTEMNIFEVLNAEWIVAEKGTLEEVLA
jgi:large subunit ribosomal protein L4